MKPTPVSHAEWNETIQQIPGAHILQTWEWATIKQTHGWEMLPMVWRDNAGTPEAAAMVLERTIRPGGFGAKFSILYVPRGPMMDWSNADLRGRVLDDLQKLAKQRGAIFIKIDPEVVTGWGLPASKDDYDDPLGMQVLDELRSTGWLYSDSQVQFKNTVWVGVSGTEDDLLARMKQKWRYNLRLAQRKGVQVRQGEKADLEELYKMYAETSLRDGFVIRSREYYLNVWNTFLDAGWLFPLLAIWEGQIIAAVMLFCFGKRAWYIYGMSGAEHREKMPNYLLQWQAMLTAREQGCTTYDLWGAPDIFDESDRMWGVFRFKDGMGGQVVRTMGAWDFPGNRWMYSIYTRVMPRVLNILRRNRNQSVRQEIGAAD